MRSMMLISARFVGVGWKPSAVIRNASFAEAVPPSRERSI